MKYFSVLEPASQKFVEAYVRKSGLDEKYLHKTHPQEDYFCISKKYPIFVVADGVTLIQYPIDNKDYPNPSPAGDVARIFCEKALEEAEARYEKFNESDIKEIFRAGNEAAGKYNAEHGRTKETVDYWDTDFYAATAAFVAVKENQIYWGSICDSYVMHFDKEGKLLFKSPECNSFIEAESPNFTGDPNSRKEKTIYTWKNKRNGVNGNGERTGYGVITGESEALLYLASGSFEADKGDLVSVLTDGFEEYMNLPEFISLFKKWPENLEQQIKKFSIEEIDKDPYKFGHERTLIMIKS